jgi:hypothetical protein
MSKPWNAITMIPTLASLLLVLFEYLYPLNGTEKLLIYFFDLFVVVILLARDFYFRMRIRLEVKIYFIHWYEFPAMLPLFLLSAFPNNIQWIAFFRTARLYNLVSRLKNSESVLLGLFAAVIIIIVGAFA